VGVWGCGGRYVGGDRGGVLGGVLRLERSFFTWLGGAERGKVGWRKKAPLQKEKAGGA